MLAAYLLVTAWNLGIQTVANPDEPRYASAARTMLRSREGRDWLVPMFNGQPHLVKPIFFYYLIAATGWAGQAVGLSEVTTYRLGPLLMGLLAVAGTFLLGARLRSARFGFLAAAVLITSGEFHKMARQLVVDMTLTGFLVWAWLFCHVALERIEIRNSKFEIPVLPLLCFYVCLGFACMTKGPFVVAMFVVVPLLLYLYWCGRLRDTKYAGLWWGVPLSLALGLWWSLALQRLGYGAESGAFFLNENLKRFAGQLDHVEHPWPFIFYLRGLGENFAPWVVLLPFVAWWAYKQRRPATENTESTEGQKKEGNSDGARFLLCALFVPFVFVGISISKRPLYLLPLYPYLSLALAWAWEEALLKREAGRANDGAWPYGVDLQRPRPRGHPEDRPTSCCTWPWHIVLLALSLGVLVAGAVGAVWWLPKHGGQWRECVVLGALSTAMAVCGCAAGPALKRGSAHWASLLVLGMAALAFVGMEGVWRPISERAANRVEFYQTVKRALQDHPVAMLGGDDPNEAAWYLDRTKQIDALVSAKDLQARFFDVPGTRLLVSEKTLLLPKNSELKKKVKAEPVASTRLGELWFLAAPDSESSHKETAGHDATAQ